MSDKLGYVVLEVGGIQKYILSTGKLKEMIGGSELIESLSSDYLADFANKNSLTILDEIRAPVDDEILPLQRNAGAMHLMFSSTEKGKEFLNKFGLKILEDFPGLPIFGAMEECEFDSLGIRDAKFKLSNKITDQRNKYPTSTGMQLLPVCATAPLDGEAAVGKIRYGNSSDRDEIVSLSSRTRRIEKLLEASRKRLRKIEPDEDLGEDLEWSDDLEDIARGLGKVAFIHIDGNDLGKRFRTELVNVSKQEEKENKEAKQIDPEKRKENTIRVIEKMSTLSKTVKDTTESAFKKGLTACLKYAHLSGRKLIPARPLVLGGDDVTIVIRPDLALYFIDAFVKEFERCSAAAFEVQNKNLSDADKQDKKGDKLTVGVGMVVCPSGYPFLKAFELSEELVKNSKELTAHIEEDTDHKEKRPSSMDYIVITNDTENDLDSIRAHLFTSDDGMSLLTAKPMLLKDNNLAQFVKESISVSEKLPRSAVRGALSECRKGKNAAGSCYKKLKDNVERGLGGRSNQKLMGTEEFLRLFPEENGFFYKDESDGKLKTKLGDYIELNHLLSVLHISDYKEYFGIKD